MWKFLTIVMLACALPLAAQDTRGQIVGRLLDQSDASIVGVTVTVVDTSTNVKTVATTNETGDYVLGFLAPGTYTVSAERKGFKRFEQTGVLVQVNDRITLNISLRLGSSSESVTVTAESPLVDSASASLGQVVDQKSALELPLKDGNPIMFSSLSPGVLNLNTSSQTRPFDNSGPSSIAVSGTPSGTNEFTLDGAPNTGGQSGNVAYIPPAGVVQEFKIQTATFDSSAGFGSGGVVNVSLRSGTNSLHGNVYEFFENPVLNANSFFNNLSGIPRSDFRENRYGATLSGPVVLPKLYHGRNKTFWMYGFEEIKDHAPRTTYSTSVPTPAEKAGDFSALLAIGPQYQIYDPATITPTSGGLTSRLPLPGNIIPLSRIAPVALAVQSYWPAPNLPGKADGSNNYTNFEVDLDSFWTHVFRVDEYLSEKGRFYVRGDINTRTSLVDQTFNNDAYGANYWRRNRGGVLDYVYMFGPNLALDVRYGYTRYGNSQVPLTENLDLQKLGFSQTFVNQIVGVDPRGLSLPQINVSGYGVLGQGSSGYPFSNAYNDIHAFGGSITDAVRNHTLKYGLEDRVYRNTSINLGSSSGNFTYSTAWTEGPLSTSPGAPMGQSYASFLLGLASSGSITDNASYAQQAVVLGGFIQDDWKFSPKLTVTLGLRYEVNLAATERYNRFVRGFDFTTPNPIQTQVQANYAKAPIAAISPGNFSVPGGLLFAGVNGTPSGEWDPDHKAWAPRIGVAYQLDRKTAFRGGIGRFYDLYRQSVIQSGFSASTVMTPTLDNGQTFVATTANPFPTGVSVPVGAVAGLMTFAGQSVSFIDPKLSAPFMDRWQVSIERQVLRNMALQVSYVGSRGRDLITTPQLDAVPLQYLSTSPVRDQTTINYLGSSVANPFYPLLPNTSLSSPTVGLSQLLRPFPEFTGITETTNRGYSNYNSLQVGLEKRFAAGYMFTASYTWSKFMSATTYLNSTDTQPEYLISSQDRPQRLAVSGIWEVPFGRGKHFGANIGGLADKIAGGWQVQGLGELQSGPALGFGNAILIGSLKDIPVSDPTVNRWLNAAPFVTASSQQLSSNIITLPALFSGIRGPGMNIWDLSVIKKTPFREGVYLEFRAEFLNAFNQPQFAPPNTTPSSTAFGTITATYLNPRLGELGLKVTF